MEAKQHDPRRPRWWILGAFGLAVFCAWLYFGTGFSAVISCRVAGGTPTNMPTTMVLSRERDATPVPVVVPRCIK
jgi:hypothetical protein